MSGATIRPCPWCGGAGRVEPALAGCYVGCAIWSCRALGPNSRTEADAIEAWNRVAELAAVSEGARAAGGQDAGAGLGRRIAKAAAVWVVAEIDHGTGSQEAGEAWAELERLAARADVACATEASIRADERERCAALVEQLPYGTGLAGKTYAEALRGAGYGATLAAAARTPQSERADGARDGAGGWMVLDTAPGHGGKVTAVLRAGGPICKWKPVGATGLFCETGCGVTGVRPLDIPGAFCPWCGWPRAEGAAGKGATDG